MWRTAATLTRDEAVARVWSDMQEHPTANAGELCLARTADNRQLCPVGLLDETVFPFIDLDSFTEMLKAPPFDGGAAEQPHPALEALRIISNRRALHQRRTLDRLRKQNEKGPKP